MTSQPQIVGSSPIRKEGRDKVLGRAQYVDDITLPGMWFGATVRSTIPRGRITSIAFDPTIPWNEYTIVSAADIPGENCIVHLTKDHPCLAVTHVNHAEEPILLLAHPNRSVLPAAVAAVHITYEELPAIYSIEDSEKKTRSFGGKASKPTPSRPTSCRRTRSRSPTRSGRPPTTSSKASTAPEPRSSSTSRTTESSPSTTQRRESR
ncbi:hypothetical protein RBB78_22095 [Tunturiibacter empetritectus]|uniref:hypothetical protein n=1 Tax=Tunturiibacter empetritectus TaxID=3069691 RepID=UPI003D9B803E